MTVDEFDLAVERTRLQERARVMARAILVDAMGPTEAARLVGLTPQAADQAARSVERAHKQLGGYPPGWEHVSLVLPPRLARRIEALGRRVQAKHLAGR